MARASTPGRACIIGRVILSSSKTKRWHGNVEAIKAEFLNGVITQMSSYGDRVHFSMFGSVQKPHYEVINSFDKMAYLKYREGDFTCTRKIWGLV